MNLAKTNLLIKMFLLVCLILILPTKTAYAADIPIFVDNVPAYSEVSPFYSNNTLLVPARLISEELGATVDWQDEQISIISNDCNILLYVGQNQALVNGTSQHLSAPPQIVQGHLFVPLRFIGEALGADVIYRDNKVFLYSTNYDEKTYLYDMLTNGMVMHKPTNITYNSKTYSLIEDRIQIYNNEDDNNITLPINNSPVLLLAISRSGLVYRNDALDEDVGTFYYNFADQKITKMFVEPFFSSATSNFDSNGCFYFPDLSNRNENIWPVPPMEIKIYYAIFSIDIDGTNRKEIFVEELNYLIRDIKYHNGWIYYTTGVPVKRDYGIDYSGGSVNRVREDGTDKQQLSGDGASYYFTEEGIYYEYDYGRGSGLLKYEDLD